MVHNSERSVGALQAHRQRHGSRRRGLCVLSFVFGTFPALLSAQSVAGRVLEEESSRPLPGVEVRLLDPAGQMAGRTLSNAEGHFSLRVERPGAYTLTAGVFGYHDHQRDVEVPGSDIRGLAVVLKPQPIQLEGITGRAARMGEHHEMSYAGFYMRARESPSIGSNRVILRTDPEFDVIATVRDLLYNFRPAEIGCPPITFWNGFSIVTPVDEFLDISSTMVEGIEYYRDLTSLPLSVRGEPAIAGARMSRIRRCGVLLIWPRRSGAGL
jgi:hypothetical protein